MNNQIKFSFIDPVDQSIGFGEINELGVRLSSKNLASLILYDEIKEVVLTDKDSGKLILKSDVQYCFKKTPDENLRITNNLNVLEICDYLTSKLRWLEVNKTNHTYLFTIKEETERTESNIVDIEIHTNKLIQFSRLIKIAEINFPSNNKYMYNETHFWITEQQTIYIKCSRGMSAFLIELINHEE